MTRKRPTSAQIALASRRAAQESRDDTPMIDGEPTPNIGVNGGFRAGKRKRGTSLLKRKPRASAVTIKYVIRDDEGYVVHKLDTLRYTK